MLSLAKTIAISMWNDAGGASLFERIWKDKRGASLLEYSLLIGIIVAVTVALIGAIGTWITGRWTGLCTALGNPPGCT